MHSVSPPCPCVSDAEFCTPQQLLWFGVPGKIRMKPFWSAYDGSRVLRSHCSPELPQGWSYVWQRGVERQRREWDFEDETPDLLCRW